MNQKTVQFKIPQDVQQADKVVGPLTLKQLIIVALGGGVSYFIYVSTAQLYVITVWLPATLVPALATLAVAFLKINGIPFMKFSLLQLERLMLKPMKRHYEKGSADPYTSCLATIPIPKEDKKQMANQKKKTADIQENLQNLDRLSKILDSSAGDPNEVTKK